MGNISTGGVGGPGGGESKIGKGVSEAGEAKKSDVESFNLSFNTQEAGSKSPTSNTAPKEAAPSSPLDFQSNRITDFGTKTEGFGSEIKEAVLSAVSAQNEKEKALTEKFTSGEPLDSASVIELQWEVGNDTNFITMISQAVAKVRDAFVTVIKGQ